MRFLRSGTRLPEDTISTIYRPLLMVNRRCDEVSLGHIQRLDQRVFSTIWGFKKGDEILTPTATDYARIASMRIWAYNCMRPRYATSTFVEYL